MVANGIRLVIFDWAGTTIDFGCQAPVAAFVALFAARGVAISTAEARAPMGLHKKDHIRAMLSQPAIAQRWRTITAKDWTERDVENLYCELTPIQIEAIQQYSQLIPGVVDTVSLLRSRGLKVAATTGYFRTATDIVLEASRKQGYQPDFAICADDVPAGRPAPWMIFRCMEATGIYPPHAVVKVGDTVVDIEDGRNAGCWSIGVVDSSNEMGLTEVEFQSISQRERDNRREQIRNSFLKAGAHAVINEIRELPSLIESLSSRIKLGERP